MRPAYVVTIILVSVVSFAIGTSLESLPWQKEAVDVLVEAPATTTVTREAQKQEPQKRADTILKSEVEIADIAEQAVAGVVNISSEKTVRVGGGAPGFGPFFNDPFFRRFFGPGFGQPSIPRERRESSLGSGVIVKSEGIILTNNHVIENATEIRVTLADGRAFGAEIVGTDPESDLILEADRQKISSVRDFREIFGRAEGNLLVLAQRGDGRLFIVLPKGE